MKNKRVVIVAVILSLIVVLLMRNYLNNLEEFYVSRGKKVDVLVSRDYIPPNSIIKEEMLKVVKVPLQFRQPGALTSLDSLVDEKGKNIYSTIVPIMIEEQVVTTKLISLQKQARLSLIIPEGKGAISLAVNKVSGIAGLIKPGDYVNLIATFQYEKKNRPATKTVTLLQNLLVLAVNKKMIGTPVIPVIPKRKDEKKYEVNVIEEELHTITLSVTPQESEKIVFAAHQGDIMLYLKGEDNREGSSLSGMNLSLILNEKNISPTSGVKMDMPPIIKGIKEILPQQY